MRDQYQDLLAAYAIGAAPAAAEAVHEVKRRLIDSFGVMAAALDADAPRAARAYAGAFPMLEGATIFGSGARSTPEAAGFANGVHVRYLDFNDTYLSLEPLHPSDTIPPLLALAEWLGRPGRELADAIAVAYEVAMTLCDAASLRAHGWDHVNYIALGTACSAARLLRLDRAAGGHAISIALVPHAAMRQTRAGELSMWKGAAAANAARNGLFAALLARHGFTGPYQPFTGEMGILRQMRGGEAFRPEPLQALQPGKAPARIGGSYIKAYPVEYHAQSAVEVVRRLHRQIGDPRRIERVQIETFKAAYEIIAKDQEKWRPTTRETADHSLPYIVAVGLLDGEVTRESFSPRRLQDSAVAALLARTKLAEAPELSVLYPESIPNRITVWTADGQTYQDEARYPRGHAGNPMPDDELVAKHQQNVPGALDPAAAARLLDMAWRLDELSDLRALTALWPVHHA